jgi:hypothetical protein
MPQIIDCEKVADVTTAYIEGALPTQEHVLIAGHLCCCQGCRNRVQREVDARLIHIQKPSVALSSKFESPSLHERWGGSIPWWSVSCILHILIIVLASLVTMAIELPRNEDAVIMITELQQRTQPQSKIEAPVSPPRNALESSRDTPPIDPSSKEASDIVVPPDILAKAELGDHFETINPDLPDTHSAFGNPEAKMFHSVEGNTEAAGGGGMGGVGMDDLIGVGGAASKGTGGGWGGGNGTGIGVGNGAGCGSFGQRGGGGRRLMVKRHGGSVATEDAVNKALQWLAYHQEPDGHWDTRKFGAVGTGHGEAMQPDTAMTSLAVLAFLGAGHTERVGQYKENVQRAVGWLIDKQQPNGLVFNKTDQARGHGYSAAMATMALAEAAGMANVKTTREAAQKAVDYCAEIHQNGDGSDKKAWRYEAKSATEDISNSGWFMMALKSAKVAGLHVNPASFEGAAKFLDKLEKKGDGADNGYGPVRVYGYIENTDTSPRRSAIGLLGRQFLGWKKEELESSVDYMVRVGGVPNPAKIDLYYWYYGTLCVFQQGGDVWKRWNDGMKTVLLPTQCKGGDDDGSWTPDGQFSGCWGRVGQTSISCLCLEVYYRYLKLAPDK